MFELKSDYQPSGDQPQAIQNLIKNFQERSKQVLLGVTGSGKTFTIANVIQQTQKPTLVISHNKTLAAQLYQEFRDFFPVNAVSYFVSYYDYYQPEAYIPQSDTYIEKETDINEDIDKLRLAATANILARKDVIVVASVSCIYNLGSPIKYQEATIELLENMIIDQKTLMTRLSQLQYHRSDYEFVRGTFRIRGDVIDLYPAYQDFGLRFEWDGQYLVKISAIDPTTGLPPHPDNFPHITIPDTYHHLTIYPARHYMTQTENKSPILDQIEFDLKQQVDLLNSQGKIIEAHRLNQRVTYDLEMIREMGYVNGIENYSRYFDGRNPDDPPFTLLDFFNHAYDDWLLVVDESHITLPQVRGMYNGDRARKTTLIDFGFRLPASLDNRPLKYDEFLGRISKAIFTSATPNEWEIQYSDNVVVEQLIRPTGLLEPTIEVRETQGQVPNLLKEITSRIALGQRVLILTLTKRTAEDLAKYLEENQIKVNYLHSEVETLDRTDILLSLRKGDYDVIVGVNLLREGIDLPEVGLVAILEADKQGFLRSTTSLLQIMGRAARNNAGHVIMYADVITAQMKAAMEEVDRRREIQEKFNQEHGITPQTIIKPIRDQLIKRTVNPEERKNRRAPTSYESETILEMDVDELTPEQLKFHQAKLKQLMNKAAKELNYELAAKIRDKLVKLTNAE